MSATTETGNVVIELLPNGPYLVKKLETLENSRGERLMTKEVIALCRCGGSSNKPYCDGTHAKYGFSSERGGDRGKDERVDYVGREVTIHDTRGICAHAGLCTEGLRAVFDSKRTPWIDPDGAESAAIVETIKACPSGALSYSVAGVEHRDQSREPRVFVSSNGPYYVTGGIELRDAAHGESASREHYTLCRCGASKNKPFCDGTHWAIEFRDEKN